MREVITALLFESAAVLLTYPARNGFIRRGRGILLLVLYAAYIATMGMGGGKADESMSPSANRPWGRFARDAFC